MNRDDSVVDLRSDTVTRPTAGMLQAMVEAEVGDDVLGDDPTVHRLQDRMAEILGKEAACFVPTGTMANSTAIRALTEPGDEIIAHEAGHFYQYESGAFAALCGCSVRLLSGKRGQFDAVDVQGAMRPPNAHFPNSALLIVENTHNRGGGSIWPMARLDAVTGEARRLGLKLHVDGARLMNASVATGISPSDYAAAFDTVSMCFSKGLGAPAGSIVAGSAALIYRVHRFRKLFGGTMRQTGILAAAALYALDHHVERLAEDHAHARMLVEAVVGGSGGLTGNPDEVETNIVYFDLDEALGTAEAFSFRLKEEGVLMLATAPQRLRAVTHLDVSREEVERAIEVLCRLQRV